MKALIAGSLLILGFSSWPLAQAQVQPLGGEKVAIKCTEIRDEPGAPTFGFDLIKHGDTYEARYLNLPGDPKEPPTVVASVDGLSCRFLSKDRLLFDCTRLGASVQSVAITEKTLSLIADEALVNTFREFRAVGNDVPGIFFVFRFGSAANCTARK